MDTEVVRTFLEIVNSGNFIRAAERLNVGQTTVSARIHLLEEQLGRPLFVRNKAGATLTPEGEQFLRYAPSFVQLWERARQKVAVPLGHRAMLAFGGELSLWDPWLLKWMLWMRRSAPDLALRAQVDVPESLMTQVAEGVLDIAVMYAPQHRPGLKIELLFEEKLVLVTTDPNASRMPLDAEAAVRANYVYVDWGADFALDHRVSFPEATNPGVFVGLGPLARDYILKAGGTGYFRMRAVQSYLEDGQLYRVPDAPEFSYPGYAVYGTNADETVLRPALEGLRAVVAAELS
jgi:LysR family transcriptional regulator, flagellar master operon regulator